MIELLSQKLKSNERKSLDVKELTNTREALAVFVFYVLLVFVLLLSSLSTMSVTVQLHFYSHF